MRYQTTLFQNYNIKSPIKYPGGKRRAVKKFMSLLPKGVDTLVSPFVGGAGIELACAANDIHVIASDNFEPLINFWKQFQANSMAVIDLAVSWFPLSFDKQKELFETGLCKSDEFSDLERAAYFFLINRQSFRGLTLAEGPQSTWDHDSCNVNLFKKFRYWVNNNITFSHSDYTTAVEQADTSSFMYFDPPYVDSERVYGCKSTRTKFDHEEFHRRITALDNKWILSYKRHDLIMDLYKDCRIIEYEFNHAFVARKGVTDGLGVTELFIVNY